MADLDLLCDVDISDSTAPVTREVNRYVTIRLRLAGHDEAAMAMGMLRVNKEGRSRCVRLFQVAGLNDEDARKLLADIHDQVHAHETIRPNSRCWYSGFPPDTTSTGAMIELYQSLLEAAKAADADRG